MKKYLRMSGHFVGKVSINTDGQICDDKFFRGSTDIAEDYYDPICHAINSHDELVAMNKELLAVVNNFHITEPDEDGCVWLVLNGNGTTGMAMFNLGNGDRIAAKVALHLESDRKAAIAKAKAAS